MINEQQIKYEINNFNEFIKTLREKEAIFIGGNLETTIRYDDKDLNLSKKGIFIRTKSGFGNVLTIKEKEDGVSNFLERKKTETEVESTESIKYLLEKIGLNNQFVMEKYRLLWKIDNQYINIDELPFGIYLEVKGNNKQINSIIKKLNLKKSKIINKTYWDLFYEKIENNEIMYSKNITFDNNYIFKIASII